MDVPERLDDLPEGARVALEQRYEGAFWTVLHAWVDDDTVLLVVSVAPDDAFDEAADAFDVDIVEVHMLRVFDTLQGRWDVVAAHQLALGALFESFVQEFFDATEPPERA